jgi:hypothetical protein
MSDIVDMLDMGGTLGMPDIVDMLGMSGMS